MIPVKLKLSNFMCYRDSVPVLFFDGIHTACICGDNGNGKSTLIDAMTWALWGKTRAKSDDDLIHLGQTDMEVEFDFAVGEQAYRIIRKRSYPRRQNRSGKTVLELQIADGDDFHPITGDSISHTQQKIISLLHMDYSTFINSAFLRQGRADEFTRQTPVQRKEVLSNILELSLYDELEERAREQAKLQDAGKSRLGMNAQEIDDELALRPEYEVESTVKQEELSLLEASVKEQNDKLERLRKEKEALESKKIQVIQLEGHIKNMGEDRERWGLQISQLRTRIQNYEELLTRRPAIEESYQQFSQVKQLVNELDKKFRLFAALNERKHQLEIKIAQKSEALVTEHALIQNRIGELESSWQKLPQLREELASLQSQSQGLVDTENTLLNRRQSAQELLNRIHALEADGVHLKQEINEAEEKLDILVNRTDAKCPLCERELELEGLELIREKYASDKDSKTEFLKVNLEDQARQGTVRESLEKEIFDMDIELKQDKQSLQGKISVLNQAISEATSAGNSLDAEREKLTEVENNLAVRIFAAAEQKALKELEQEMADIGYDSQQHEILRQHLAGLQQDEEPKRKLEEAIRLIDQERLTLSQGEEASGELRKNSEADNQKKRDLEKDLEQLPRFTEDLTVAENEYLKLYQEQKQLQEAMWQIKAMLQRCADLEIKRKEMEKQLSILSTEEGIYRDLAEAFGKRGVQALIIEAALPEIEAEADRLLGRMTDNRMHVKIETQRETKKGDVLETLDINISDELGARNYEMFSGGEAFRINFAIRIALSKLLARRAGAPLPTLIIDEGFGTQDDAGIEKIKEAINSIQEDFDKILVITHIEEMRDAFPTRIDVVKTAEGSTIDVN
ncbi:AAA family ATPase [Chloroflexota bacterium]